MNDEDEIKALEEDLKRIEANKEAWANHYEEQREERPNIPKFDEDLSLEERAQKYEAFVIERFAELVNDIEAPASARVSAGNAILDRAAGKAVAKVEVEHKNSELELHLEKARELRKLKYEPVVDVDFEKVDTVEVVN